MYDSKISVSENDRRALDIMEQTVKLENGHYKIALSWKCTPRVFKTIEHLPNLD